MNDLNTAGDALRAALTHNDYPTTTRTLTRIWFAGLIVGVTGLLMLLAVLLLGQEPAMHNSDCTDTPTAWCLQP